jgi:hypothetical protein
MRQLSSKTKAQSDRIAVTLPLEALSFLQRFALKTKPRDFLKVLRSDTFKKSLVVRLIGNCSKEIKKPRTARLFLFLWSVR